MLLPEPEQLSPCCLLFLLLSAMPYLEQARGPVPTQLGVGRPAGGALAHGPPRHRTPQLPHTLPPLHLCCPRPVRNSRCCYHCYCYCCCYCWRCQCEGPLGQPRVYPGQPPPRRLGLPAPRRLRLPPPLPPLPPRLPPLPPPLPPLPPFLLNPSPPAVPLLPAPPFPFLPPLLAPPFARPAPSSSSSSSSSPSPLLQVHPSPFSFPASLPQSAPAPLGPGSAAAGVPGIRAT